MPTLPSRCDAISLGVFRSKQIEGQGKSQVSVDRKSRERGGSILGESRVPGESRRSGLRREWKDSKRADTARAWPEHRALVCDCVLYINPRGNTLTSVRTIKDNCTPGSIDGASDCCRAPIQSVRHHSSLYLSKVQRTHSSLPAGWIADATIGIALASSGVVAVAVASAIP